MYRSVCEIGQSAKEERFGSMAKNIDITDVIKEGATAAYFDLEFCNENTSRHNVPVAIGISYRQGGREIGSYSSLIWCGDEYELWKEQLTRIGYEEETLRMYGKPMEEVTEEILAAHKEYQPKLYISLGKQDEDLLKRFVTQELEGLMFYDAVQFLPGALSLKYDISLEKYAHICGIAFVHKFLPLEDARTLADIVYNVLQGNVDEGRRQEVEEEYDRRMFVSQYKNKRQAYEYLLGLECLTPGQREKMKGYEKYLEENRGEYLEYMGE